MLFLLSFIANFLFVSAAPVSVTVNSTAVQRGDFHLAIYATPEDYRARKPITGGVRPASNGLAISVELPTTGNYVISGYHDVNGNGELDFNFLGIPKEPYGFVTVPDSKFKEPEFGEIATPIAGGESVVLDLKLWKEF